MLIRCENCFETYESSFGMCPYCGHEEGSGAQEAFCLMPGTRIAGRYRVGQLLGNGGFGIIYKAWDEKFEKVVAIKEFFPSGLVNRTVGSSDIILVAKNREAEFKTSLNRFLEEARNTAKFNHHPNIVNVYDYFEENHTAYFVMEYLDGVRLDQRMRDNAGPLPYEECTEIVESLCSALSAVHQEHILHRDVSPDNIMLCKDGSVKLFDFGAARFSATAAEDTTVTVIVKPGFAPPEQYENVNRQDARTDIYALGATLYYILTGCKPEESTNRKIKDELVPPEQINPNIPHYVNNAILRAMALEQQYRFNNVEEFRKALVTRKKVADPKQLKNKRKRRRRIGILAAVICVIAAFAVFGLRLYEQVEENTLPAASITVWYIDSGDGETDRLTGLQTVAESFMSAYDGVEVMIVGVEENEYEQKLTQAIASGEAPDIYEATGLTMVISTSVLSLSDVYQKDSSNIYLMNLRSELESDLYYPTGMVIPVIYVNTFTGVSLDDTASFDAILDSVQNFLVSDEAAAGMFAALYDGNSFTADENALELFSSGEYSVLLGTSADYFSVKNALTGHYSILIPETGYATYTYANLWSIRDGVGANEEKVAKAFLNYLLDNVSQEILHFGDVNDYAMPVEEISLQDYLELYSEFTDAGVMDYLKLPYISSND